MVVAVIHATHPTADADRLRSIVDVLTRVNVLDISIVVHATTSWTNGTLEWFTGKIVTSSAQGELEFIAAGIGGCSGDSVRGVLIWPQETEMVSAQLVATLLHEFLKSQNEISLPSRDGICLMPLILPLWVIDELRSHVPSTSLQEFLQLHSTRVVEVPMDEKGHVIRSSTFDVDGSGRMDNRL